MVGIKVLFIDFLKKVNSYLFFSEILNSYLEKLIPTYLLVKSLIPSLNQFRTVRDLVPLRGARDPPQQRYPWQSPPKSVWGRTSFWRYFWVFLIIFSFCIFFLYKKNIWSDGYCWNWYHESSSSIPRFVTQAVQTFTRSKLLILPVSNVVKHLQSTNLHYNLKNT